MLAAGDVDAVLHPEILRPFAERDPRVARLFPDYKRVEIEYYRRTGIFPIMHVTAIRKEIADEHPWAAQSLMRAFEESKQIAYRRLENPRIVPLAWYREAWEEQLNLLGSDPWEYGLGARNRNNLETAIGYSHECGLISCRPTLEQLFLGAN